MARVHGQTGHGRDEFEQWLVDIAELSPSTARMYGSVYQRIVDADADGDAWLQAHVDRDTPIGTRRVLCAVVVNLARFRANDPRLAVELPDLPRPRKRVRYQRDPLSEEDVEAYEQVLEECELPSTSRAVLRLLPWTGLRINELCSVRRRDLALKRTATGRPGIEVVGKGSKLRWVPLTATAIDIVREYLGEAREEERDLSTWLFPAERNPEKHVHPGVVRNDLYKIRDRLPVTARAVTPHVLRHTVATRLLEADVNLVVIQTILGHASLKTTEVYLHPSKRKIADAFDKL